MICAVKFSRMSLRKGFSTELLEYLAMFRSVMNSVFANSWKSDDPKAKTILGPEDLIDYLKELLTGPWPEERFLVKQPGQVIETRELQI